jgi:hypothetical protein
VRACAPLLLLTVLCGACAPRVLVRAEGAHTHVVVDGKDLGHIPAGGTSIDVSIGADAVPYEVHNGDVVRRGELPRSDTLWWLVAAGVGGAVCCVPTLAAAGCCIANPAVLGIPIAVGITGNVGALVSVCAAPSWLTLPGVALGALAGASPLGLAFLADTLPPVVTLPMPGPPGPPVTSSTGATGPVMLW